MKLDVAGVQFNYSSHPVLDDITFTVSGGELVGIVGPNGSGKSTLLQIISRALTPKAGVVTLDAESVALMPARELARRLCVVRQHESVAFDFSVSEVVLMGRLPYLGPFGRESATDHEAASSAMAAAGVSHLASRHVHQLSGGEFQRVALARALAQNSPVVLLDEPTSSLDLKYQIQVLHLLKQLTLSGKAIVVTLHDLNLASQYCDRLIVLQQGRIYAAGPPDQVIDATLIEEVYNVQAVVESHPVTHKPYIFPHYS